MERVSNELASTHVVLLAVDVDASNTPDQTAVDARPRADQRVVAVAADVEVLPEVDPVEFALYRDITHWF